MEILKPKQIKLYMDIANRIAEESYATRTKVGCIIVKNSNIISFGYNGTPGWSNVCEVDNVTKPETLHAEENAILKLAKYTGNAEGSIAFSTLSPCFHCARMIFRSGMKEFYYQNEYRSFEGIDFLKKAGVWVVKYDPIEINDE